MKITGKIDIEVGKMEDHKAENEDEEKNKIVIDTNLGNYIKSSAGKNPLPI